MSMCVFLSVCFYMCACVCTGVYVCESNVCTWHPSIHVCLGMCVKVCMRVYTYESECVINVRVCVYVRGYM